MFAIIRRTRAGQPIMAADRQHLHHRLLNIGHSYRQSVLIMYLWAALFSVTVVSLSIVRTPSVVFIAATGSPCSPCCPLPCPACAPGAPPPGRRPRRPAPPERPRRKGPGREQGRARYRECPPPRPPPPSGPGQRRDPGRSWHGARPRRAARPRSSSPAYGPARAIPRRGPVPQTRLFPRTFPPGLPVRVSPPIRSPRGPFPGRTRSPRSPASAPQDSRSRPGSVHPSGPAGVPGGPRRSPRPRRSPGMTRPTAGTRSRRPSAPTRGPGNPRGDLLIPVLYLPLGFCGSDPLFPLRRRIAAARSREECPVMRGFREPVSGGRGVRQRRIGGREGRFDRLDAPSWS